MPISKLEVSVSDLTKRPRVQITQGDRRSRVIEATVTDGGSPMDLTGKRARFRAELPHGKVVIDDGCEVADPESGVVVYTLSDEMAASHAVITNAYFEVYDDAGYSLAASKMVIEVGGGVDLGGARPSDYVPELDRLKAEARDAIVACEDAAAKANATASQAASDAQAAIAEVKATEAKLYPVAENILVGSETGTVAHVDDAFASASLRKITVEGACKQDGIPSPEEPKPITVVEHPTVKVVGKNLWSFASSCSSTKGHQNEFVRKGTPFTLLPGEYTFSAVGSLGNTDAPLFGYTATGERVQFFRIMRNVSNPKYGFTVTEPIASIYFVSNAADSNVGTISSIQLERNSTATEYKPHTSQTLTFALPAEHPYLAKLPDGTADEITVDEEGNVELVARVVRLTDLANQGVVSNTPIDGGNLRRVSVTNMDTEFAVARNTLSEVLPFVADYSFKSRGVYLSRRALFIGEEESVCGTTSEDAKAYLESTVRYVYGILAEPTRYNLGKIDMPKAQDSIINVWTDAEVTPNTSISYVRDVNIVVANLEAAIASITQG